MGMFDNPFANSFGSGFGSALQQQQQYQTQLDKYQLFVEQQLRAMNSLVTPAKPAEAKPITEEEIMCATGGLIAWRAWNCGMFDSRIRSFNGVEWEPYKKHVAMDKGGGRENYGIYAWKSREQYCCESSVVQKMP